VGEEGGNKGKNPLSPTFFYKQKSVYFEGGVYGNFRKKIEGGYVGYELSGVEDINKAELLRNLYVEVEEKDLEPLGENEYYVYQLLGCDVLDENYGFLGKVKDLHEWAPYWTLEVFGEKEILIPFVSEFVIEVDVERKEIRTRLPKGYVEAL